MTRSSIVVEGVPWGKSVKTTPEDVAFFFYQSPGWENLKDAQALAMKKKGRIESAHGILEQRLREPLNGLSWTNLLTANYEEDMGLDVEGRFGKKGEAVFVAIQGGGIMLSCHQRLLGAYLNRTPKEEPSLRQGEISQVLTGMLPNRQQIRLYTLQSLTKEDPEQLPPTYAIVTPARELEGTPSGLLAVEKLPKNKVFIMRAGHATTAENYAQTLQRAGVVEYGNWHNLAGVPKDPSGRVLQVHIKHNYGLSSDDLLDEAHFVVVCKRTEGAAPQKSASSLERLTRGTRYAGN